MYSLSLLWQIPLGVALLALAWLFFSLAFRLGSTLKSIEIILDKQVSPLLEDVNQTVEDINQKLPDLLEHVNQLAYSIHELTEREIQPTLHNVQETTETLNHNVTRIDELVSIISEFSKQTVDSMSSYRDRLSIPFNDLIGFCAAFKAGFEKFTSKNN